MTQTISLATYDFYKQFDSETQERLKDKADHIRSRHKSLLETILAIGKDLLEEKEALPHGQFGKWLALEFPDYSHQTLNNYMSVYIEFGDDALQNPNGLENFSARGLYAASARSTPPEVREEARSLSQRGEKVTSTTVDALKIAAKNDELEAAGEVNDPFERHVYRGKDVIAEIGQKDTLSSGQEIRYREGSNCLFAWKKDPKTIFKIAKKDIESFPVFLPTTRVQTLYGEGIIDFEPSDNPAKVFVKMDGTGQPRHELPISAINILSSPDTTESDIEDKSTSVDRELESQAENLGLPTGEQTLPDIARNEGDPATLQPRGMDAVGAMPPEISEGVWVCKTLNYKKVVRELACGQTCYPDCGVVREIKGRFAYCKWNSGLVDEKFPIESIFPLPANLQMCLKGGTKLTHERNIEDAIFKYLGEEGRYPFEINPNPRYFKTKVLGGYRILLTRECPPMIIPEILKAHDKKKIARCIILLSINFCRKQVNAGAFQLTLGQANRVLWPLFFEDLLVLNFEEFDKDASPYGGFVDCFRRLGAWGAFSPRTED